MHTFTGLEAQLKAGVKQVRATLGDAINVSDETIRETLWYYYFHVDQTITYLLGTWKRDVYTRRCRAREGSQTGQTKG
jgi:hypothetical protein